jgi:Na+/proline symporter
MVLSLVLSVVLISQHLDLDGRLFSHISESFNSKIFHTDWHSDLFFPKAFFGGMFISITMTGMDQEMMQKNISCRSLAESQKNMVTFSFVMVIVTLLFLVLGVLIWDYAATQPGLLEALKSKTMLTDELFPTIALNSLGTVSALFFIIGLISAAYPSADGALTALTASFCIDFLGFNNPAKGWTEERSTRVRKIVHISFAFLLLIVMLVLNVVNDRAIIGMILFLASITYGPLLGLFAFGILTKRSVRGWGVVIACCIPPLICYLLRTTAKADTTGQFLGGYKFGNELLIINGLLTFTGLWLISKKAEPALA